MVVSAALAFPDGFLPQSVDDGSSKHVEVGGEYKASSPDYTIHCLKDAEGNACKWKVCNVVGRYTLA